ncbi:MAG: glutathione S-transferase family protein [Beijerinckiaceae bacterium]
MTYKLHSFCQSGNAFKAATMLNLLGQPWEPVFVDFLAGETRRPEWRDSVNEMGEAPVLEDGPVKMSQSGVILDYLAGKHGRFGGRTAEEKREVLRWILFDNHKFTSYLATYRFLKCFMPREPDAAVMAWLKGRVDAAFAIAEKHLAAQDFIAGPDMTIADISMCGYLFYPAEEHGYDFAASHPNMARWLGQIAAQKGFRMPYDTLPGERIAPRR